MTESVEKLLGDIRESIGGLRQHNVDVIRRLDSADESRRSMYARFDRHNADVAELREHGDKRFDALDRRVAKIEEQMERVVVVVARAETLETQGRTVLAVGSVLGSRAKQALIAIGLLAAAFWREILAVIRGG